MARPSVGCAFLADSTSIRGGGWASARGRAAIRFTSADSLAAHQCIWVTTAPHSVFLSDGGAAYPFLRSGGFLPTPVAALAQEIGTGDPTEGELLASRLSEILNRVVDMATDLTGQADLLSLMHGGHYATLAQALEQCVSTSSRQEHVPAELLQAYPSMFKPLPAMGTSSAQDDMIRIPANRMALARIALNTGIPAGGWTELQATAGSGLDLSTLIELRKALVCQVTIRGPLSKVRAFAPLTRNYTQGATRWLALPELIALSTVFEIVPRKAYVAEALVPVQATLKVPPPLFTPAAQASISAGLLAETYLHAASAQPIQSGSDPGGNRLPAGSMRAAWLTSIVRSYMLQEALALSEQGFSVVGIGSSHVVVATAKRNLHLLRKALSTSHLLAYPTWLRSQETSLTAAALRARTAAETGVG